MFDFRFSRCYSFPSEHGTAVVRVCPELFVRGIIRDIVRDIGICYKSGDGCFAEPISNIFCG